MWFKLAMYVQFTGYMCLFQMLLPSYKYLLVGEESQFSREQVETLLHMVCRTYASICGIYNATWGGVTHTPSTDDKTVKRSVKHEKDNILEINYEAATPVTDPHKMVKFFNLYMCKAHYNNAINSELVFKENEEFDYKYFEPYTDLLTTLTWSNVALQHFPEDVFTKFSELIYFNLGYASKTMTKLTKLPTGIGQAKKLRVSYLC